MTTDSKEWIVRGREYADAIDKDRGFESGVTDCLRGMSDALEAMVGEVERLKDRLRIANGVLAETNQKALDLQTERDRLAGEVERLKRMLFPYAEDKEISGVTWNGFYLIGNKKSIDEFKRLENRAAQLETYRAEFVRRNEAAEAERDRLAGEVDALKHDIARHMTIANEAAAERDRLKAALVRTAASLAAAISLLERGSKVAKKAAPSNKMFDQMLVDYTRALNGARKALGGDAE